jgi:predicted amidohydrolase
MTRIALANLRFPSSPDDSITQTLSAIQTASTAHADILCSPECFVPGYRARTQSVPPPDAAFLTRAHQTIAAAAGRANLAVILGTERIADKNALLATALVIDRDGSILGFQDKVQLAPQEEGTYTPGQTRHIFRSGDLTFGISICQKAGATPKPFAGPSAAAPRSSSIPTSTAPSPTPTAPPPSPTRQTPSSRRPCSAAPPKTPATSPA